MGPKEIAENILKKVDDFRISLQAETLARAYLELEKELKAHNEYQKWGPTKVLILEVEITKLSEANTKLRAALEKIVTLSTYAGKITKDVEHYMTMRIASRAPEIAREALEKLK